MEEAQLLCVSRGKLAEAICQGICQSTSRAHFLVFCYCFIFLRAIVNWHKVWFRCGCVCVAASARYSYRATDTDTIRCMAGSQSGSAAFRWYIYLYMCVGRVESDLEFINCETLSPAAELPPPSSARPPASAAPTEAASLKVVIVWLGYCSARAAKTRRTRRTRTPHRSCSIGQ